MNLDPDFSKSGRPLVSVIVPVYNVAPYLREALDSLIGQTYDDLEILIIDDGSTDGSDRICDEYGKNARVQVIHQDNRGLSNARNTGLDLMTGQYVAFLDPDDAYHMDFIRLLMDVMIKEEPAIAVCRYTVYHTVNEMRPTGKKITEPSLKEGIYNRVDALRALIDSRLNTTVWNKLYRAGLWETIRFPDGHNYEDIDTMYRILDRCDSVFLLDRPLYLHRKRPGSITRTNSEKNISDMELACSHLEAFVEAHTPEIFSEEQLMRHRQSRLNRMMVQFAKDRSNNGSSKELKGEIIALGNEIGIESCRFRTKAAYAMVRSCPWLLKITYPVYLPFRLLVWKVTGR